MHIFRRIFLSNYWWQESDIWSQASYRYAILWEVILDSCFLFADLVGFYTHWTYMHIFRHIFLSNYWWQKSDIWSQASYMYPISWEAFLDPSDSYFLLRYTNVLKIDLKCPEKYIKTYIFSSADPKGHVSYCHHLASVVRRKLFQKSSPLKPLGQFKPNLAWVILRGFPLKIMSDDPADQPSWPPCL